MEQEGFGPVPAASTAAIAADATAREYRFGQHTDGFTKGVGQVSARFDTFLQMLNACCAEMCCEDFRYFKPCIETWYKAATAHRLAHPDRWPSVDSLPEF